VTTHRLFSKAPPQDSFLLRNPDLIMAACNNANVWWLIRRRELHQVCVTARGFFADEISRIVSPPFSSKPNRSPAMNNAEKRKSASRSASTEPYLYSIADRERNGVKIEGAGGNLTCQGWLPKLDECPPTILLLLVYSSPQPERTKR